MYFVHVYVDGILDRSQMNCITLVTVTCSALHYLYRYSIDLNINRLFLLVNFFVHSPNSFGRPINHPIIHFRHSSYTLPRPAPSCFYLDLSCFLPSLPSLCTPLPHLFPFHAYFLTQIPIADSCPFSILVPSAGLIDRFYY